MKDEGVLDDRVWLLTEVPPRIVGQPSEYFNCFGHVLDTQEEISDPRVFMQRLNEQGYKPAEHPGLGDIVLYTKPEDDLPLHAGILIGKNTVESKLGKGHIYRHPLNAGYILSEYGDNIRFLTKRPELSPQ